MSKPEGIPSRAEAVSFWRSISLMADVTALCRSSSMAQPPFREALRLIRKLLPFDAATLYIYNTKCKLFEAKTSLDGRVEWLKPVILGSEENSPLWSLPEKRPVLLSDADRKSLPANMNQWLSVLAAPLFSGEILVGVLTLACRRAEAFDENDIKLISVVADLFAAATERWFHKDREILLSQALTRIGDQETGISDADEMTNRLAVAAELVASVHHQINNPLAVIVGNVQCLLIEKKDLDEKALGRLKLIEKAALKVSKVNRNLLTVSSLAREQIGAEDAQASTANAG